MKEQTNNRTKRIICRLSPEEYMKIHGRWQSSTCRKLSDYLRRKLLDKPIVATYRNQSLDDFMAETMRLRNELNAIGNNFNQAVKKLHTLQNPTDFKQWIITWGVDKKIFFDKVETVKNHIQKVAEKWLQ